MKNKIYIILFLILCKVNAFSQESLNVLTKVSRDTIGYYDILTATFEVNDNDADLQKPILKDFEVYEEKPVGYEITYTKGIRTTKKIYTYLLKPKRSGKLILENVIFDFNGKQFETIPVTVYVKGDTVENDPLNKNNKIFAVAHISNYNPYKYQPLTIEYKLYFEDGLKPSSIQTDFNAEYLKEFKLYSISQKSGEATKEKFNGKEYNCILLRKDIIRFKELYSTFLTNRIVVNYDKPLFMEDNSNIYETSKKILPIISKRIEVRNFTYDSKFPHDIKSFGDFKLEVFHPKKTKIEKNKIIEITVQLYGEGYIEDDLIPQIYIPEAFEIISNTVKNDATLENGKVKTIAIRTYKIKPLLEGDYTFYPVKFHFYNESKGEKKAINSKEFTLSVK